MLSGASVLSYLLAFPFALISTANGLPSASLLDLVACKLYSSPDLVSVQQHVLPNGALTDVQIPKSFIAQQAAGAELSDAAITAAWQALPEQSRLDLWRANVSSAEWASWQSSRAGEVKIRTARFLKRDLQRASAPVTALIDALSDRTETATAIEELLTNTNITNHPQVKEHLLSLPTAAATNDEAPLAVLNRHDASNHERGAHRLQLIPGSHFLAPALPAVVCV